jgi:NAD(P)-dependent dehydrogenase (short-subunit alcohol dehydrogenase family)
MEALNQVADEARGLGVDVVADKCDVSDYAAVSSFVKKTVDRFGRVDVAINLAGFRAEAPFLEETFEVFNRTIAVNLAGPYNICRNVIPYMVERRWGRIINICGISPYLGVGPAKAMVKLGTVGFTRGLAREFGRHNITVNCVGPGMIERGFDPDVTDKPLNPRQPIPRKGTQAECVSLLVYLASESAGFITGQSYLVNGGAYFQ